MRKMLIGKVPQGMILGKTVFSPNGHVLLADGTELTSEYLMRLQALGFPAVLVKESYCCGLRYPEIVSDKMRADGMVTLRHIFEEVKKYKKIDTGAVKTLVKQLADEVMRNRKSLLELGDIRSYDGYLYGHSLNVCILSLRLGLMLDYNELQLRDLGIGAILHDIGMLFVEKQVVEKAGKLKTEEFEKIKQHCALGFNLLREQKDINLLSAHVAFQHHERFDGSGYPRLLKRGDICEFARIVAVADVFDALTSEKKHRKSYPYHAAVDILKNEAGSQIDPELSNLFMRNVALYPTGSLVELNSGEIAMVTGNKPQETLKPTIKILTDSNKLVISNWNFREVDLCLENGLKIEKLIEDDNVVAAFHKIFSQVQPELTAG